MIEDNGTSQPFRSDVCPDAQVVISFFKETGTCHQSRTGEFPIPLLVNMLEVIKAEVIQRQMLMAAQAQAAQQASRIQVAGQMPAPPLRPPRL